MALNIFKMNRSEKYLKRRGRQTIVRQKGFYMFFKRCAYCKCITIRPLIFENEIICRKCNEFVPRWTNEIRKALNDINSIT